MTTFAIDWDAGNLAKCQGHGVSVAEIEWVIGHDPIIEPDIAHSLQEERLRAVGLTQSGRFVFLSFTLRQRGGQTLIRPVSARYMHAREIRRYEKGAASPEEISDADDG